MILQYHLYNNTVTAVAEVQTFVGDRAVLEGLTFLPDSTHPRGGLYLASGEEGVEMLDVFWASTTVPSGTSTSTDQPQRTTAVTDGSATEGVPKASVRAVRRLGHHLLSGDLPSNVTKIAALVVDPRSTGYGSGKGTLYVLYQKAYRVRAWDLASGAMVGEWQTPGSSNEWEGMFITYEVGRAASRGRPHPLPTSPPSFCTPTPPE